MSGIQPRLSVVSEAIAVPVRGELITDPETGGEFRLVIGYEPGAHRNVARSALTADVQAALASAGVEMIADPDPETPQLIWSGDERVADQWRDTVFLRASDEETMLAGLLAAGLARAVPD